MQYVVLDAETTIRNRGDGAVGGMGASPFLRDNRIIAFGELYTRGGEPQYESHYSAQGLSGDTPDTNVRALYVAASGKDVLLVGQNITFDVLYLMKEFPLQWEAALPHLYIWDTQQVEYLLSGQSETYPSLDQMAEKRGLPLKDDRIKGYWDQGIDTDMIPQDELLDYLRHDVETTWKVFLDQYEEVRSNPNLFLLVKVKMEDILATTIMTWNGMKFDLETAAKKLEVLDKEIEELHSDIKAEGQAHFAEDFEFNPESPTQLSALLFGGKYKVVRDMPVLENGEPVKYKGGARAGQIKTRKEAVVLETKGLGLPTKGVPTSRDGFSTADEWLAKLKHPVVKKIQRLRELSKDAETYYRGYSALVWPDGCIHPQRNHAATVTGRLSCSAPNLENVSKDDD